MPVTDSFYIGGRGNGFPFCLQDLPALDPGFPGNERLSFFEIDLEDAMKIYWSMHSISCDTTLEVLSGGLTSFEASETAATGTYYPGGNLGNNLSEVIPARRVCTITPSVIIADQEVSGEELQNQSIEIVTGNPEVYAQYIEGGLDANIRINFFRSDTAGKVWVSLSGPGMLVFECFVVLEYDGGWNEIDRYGEGVCRRLIFGSSPPTENDFYSAFSDPIIAFMTSSGVMGTQWDVSDIAGGDNLTPTELSDLEDYINAGNLYFFTDSTLQGSPAEDQYSGLQVSAQQTLTIAGISFPYYEVQQSYRGGDSGESVSQWSPTNGDFSVDISDYPSYSGVTEWTT